jgi:DNA-binding CsgD family transcriptional regulator
MGDLVARIGSAAFGSEYFRFFNDALAIEHCTVFAFQDGSLPAALVTECTSSGSQEQVRQLAHEYVTGAFRKDPNIRRDVAAATPVVYTLRAEDVRDVAYRRHFYDEPSLSHELVLLGSVNGTLYYSSFYRGRTQPEFRRDDLDMVQLLAYFAIKALQRHVELQSQVVELQATSVCMEDAAQFGNRWEEFQHLKDILLAGARKLSPREAQVCAAIVLGYSTLAISLNLGISLNTVATHRKRAYSKLGICSQNELFAQYFKSVTKFNARND